VAPEDKPAIRPNPHDIIEFSFYVKQDVFAICAPLYKKGQSLSEISLKTKFPVSTIRSNLIRGGVELRAPIRFQKGSNQIKRGLWIRNLPYGFCYFEGRVQRHLNQYPFLLQIINKWKKGSTVGSITRWLNEKGIPSQRNMKWQRKTVTHLIKRIKDGRIVQNGAHYELR
jgi:hypothetical protein